MSVVDSGMPVTIVTHVRPLEGRYLELRFSDGLEGAVNINPFLDGPVFEPLRKNDALFMQVSLDGWGAPCWPGDIDLAPESLRAALAVQRRPR